LQQILGFEPQETEPTLRWWRERIHPQDVSPVGSQVEEQLTQHRKRHFAEYRIRHRDGHWIYVADRGLAVYDAAGRPVRVVGSTIDVTARKNAERALRESEERFGKAFQLAPIAMSISTLDEGRYLDVNAALLAVTGYARDEVVGHTARELKVYADPADFGRVRQTLSSERSIRGLDMQLRGKHGDVRTALLSGDIIELEGTPCLLTASIDITERKAWEAALGDSETRYRALVENANDVVATLDLEFRFTSVNPAVERILGYTPEEMVRTPLSNYVPPDQLELHREMLARKLHGEEATRYEMQLLAKDGRSRFTLEVSSKLLRDETGKAIAIHAIARDVTERKNADARQALLVRELQHRTKNLLAVVQSIVSNTLRPGSDTETARRALLGRLHALAHAQDFVASGASGGVPLRELVEAELAAFPDRVEFDGTPLVVGGAFAQTFALVLHELATNAVKHGALTTRRGSVAIIWKVAGRPGDEWLEFTWTERGGPRLEAPGKPGFGTQVIGLLGQPQIRLLPEGLECSIRVPLEDVLR
jgi:PAS domain S-box-containing protein